MSEQDNGFTHRDGVGLHEHLDETVKNLRERMDLSFELRDLAISKAEGRMDDKLETMNNLRQQVDRVEGTLVNKETFEGYKAYVSTELRALTEFKTRAENVFITQEVLEAKEKTINLAIGVLNDAKARAEGKASAAIGVAILGILVSIAVAIFSK